MDIFSYAIAVVALIKETLFVIIVGFVTNFRDFQIDDKKYYILVERLSTRRWYARNGMLFGLCLRLIIILVFVVGFQRPAISGLIIVLIQGSYSLLSFVSLPYIKPRYSIFNLISNLLTAMCFFFIYQCAVNL